MTESKKAYTFNPGGELFFTNRKFRNVPVNRLEVISFLESFFTGLKTQSPQGTELKPFLDLVASLKPGLPLSIPLLRDLAALDTAKEASPLRRRIDRRYRRLCRIQEELGRLDFKKAAPGVSPEDYIFSKIDFSRYRQIDETEFECFFSEGIADFAAAFFTKNFGLERGEVQSLMEKSYEKKDGAYRIRKETPLALSIMRSLETSLESLPLLSPGEIGEELGNFFGFLAGGAGEARGKEKLLSGKHDLFPRLVLSLAGTGFLHKDGMTTKLFVSERGDLSGIFRPGNKAWTLVLVPAEIINGA